MSYKSSRVTGDNLYHSDHERKLSTSSSDYSYDSDAKSEASTRRGTTPSKGGADRRRVAIVQMPSFRSRRGQTGLALVAPPDAAPTNYTHLTPPPIANIPSDQDTTLHQRDISTTKDDHQNSSRRSQSPYRRLTTSNIPLSPSPMFSPVTPDIGQAKEIHIPGAGSIVVNLGSHLRNAPSSGTDSPPPDPSLLATPISSYLHYQPGVHSVAGPLPPPPRANFNIDIHNPPPPRPPRLDSRTPIRSNRELDAVKQSLQLPPSVTAILASKSSNLSTKSYKDGPISDLSDVISNSKPDIKPSKEVLFTDLINADSNSDIKPLTKPYKEVPFTDLSDVDSKSDIKPSPEHRREGTFSPLDDILAEPPSKSAPESTNPDGEIKDVTVDTAGVTVVEPLCNRTVTEINHHKFSQWLKSNPELSQPLGNKRKAGSIDESHFYKQRLPESPEPSDSGGGSDAPSPPPKSFRNSLTMNLKRLSLPRTASLSSKSARSRRWSGENTYHSSRTSSPSIHRVSPPPLVPRIKSTNPAALFCHEVRSQRTTSERCLIYATKINELHLYDCGLSEWVVNMKSRGPSTQHQRVSSVPQPRHTSRSSVMSQATFPTRADASTATDLSQGTDGDITPTSVSLTLPYPSLAMNPPRTNSSRSNSSIGPSPSIRSLTPSTSISLKSGGFFASLGRKTSISKKDKPTSVLITSSSSGSLVSPSTKSGRLLSISSKHTSSPSINTMNISRPFNISSPPSVPGGPRAPPNRTQRSHTFTPSFPPTSPIVNSDIGRRPSMFDLSLDPVIDIRAEPEFIQQVDKLAGLLPHANRDVLAGYLRRAGTDMLAIGQYLEDEKNGTIQLYD